MMLQVKSTDMITKVNGQLCRVWTGVTEKGAHCVLFTALVCVPGDQDSAIFERELKEHEPPKEVPMAFVLASFNLELATHGANSSPTSGAPSQSGLDSSAPTRSEKGQYLN